MNLIKKRREELKLSQAQLGKIVGCSQQHIDRYERGYDIKPEKILIFSKWLNIPIEELIPEKWKEVFNKIRDKSLNGDIYSTVAMVVKTVEDFLTDNDEIMDSESKAKLIASLVSKLADTPQEEQKKFIEFAIGLELDKKAI